MNIRITNDPTREDMDEIYCALKAYNLSKREPSENVPIGIFLEDESQIKKAGLTGEIFGNWLCIKYLWVSDSLRHQGIGSSLIKKAEDEAIRQGAKYVFVDTFSFQAPEFYRKLGFKEVFQLKEYPYTGSRSYFTKELKSGKQ